MKVDLNTRNYVRQAKTRKDGSRRMEGYRQCQGLHPNTENGKVLVSES